MAGGVSVGVPYEGGWRPSAWRRRWSAVLSTLPDASRGITSVSSVTSHRVGHLEGAQPMAHGRLNRLYGSVAHDQGADLGEVDRIGYVGDVGLSHLVEGEQGGLDL